MIRLYYQANCQHYQVVIDNGICHIYSMKQSLDVNRMAAAWNYQKKLPNVDECNNYLMHLLKVKHVDDLKKKEISEEKIQQIIANYVYNNQYRT